MKQLIKSKAAFLLATCTFILLLSSGFISRPGGEGFEVYINHKLVLQQFGKDINTTKSISLANAKPDEEVLVKYHRCGNGSHQRPSNLRTELWTFIFIFYSQEWILFNSHQPVFNSRTWI